MVGQPVEIGVVAGPGQDRNVALGDLAPAFAFKCAHDDGSPTGGVAAADETVDESDQVVGEPDGDLRGGGDPRFPRKPCPVRRVER